MVQNMHFRYFANPTLKRGISKNFCNCFNKYVDIFNKYVYNIQQGGFYANK